MHRKLWHKMKERGLDRSLIEIKKGDVVAMVNCLNMLKEQQLAYIINRLSLSMVRGTSGHKLKKLFEVLTLVLCRWSPAIARRSTVNTRQKTIILSCG